MKILIVNVVCGIKSTGRICTDLADGLTNLGHEVRIAYGREEVPKQYQHYAMRIGNDRSIYLHVLKSRLLDAAGFGSKRATKKFLKWADEYNPDLIWLHNLHGYYINIELLFQWIKLHPEKEVKWTLHDCWPFTGHCTHFTMAKCNKWKEGCQNCPQTREYPASRWLDRSKKNYKIKKALFCNIGNMKIITPSQWLADLVSQSFMKEYSVEVRYNTVDETVFRPIKSDFKEKHGLNNKTIILGVASTWGKKKGLDDFLELAQMLDDRYVIILVGMERRQIKDLKKRNRILDIKELEKENDIVITSNLSGCKKTASNRKGIVIPESVECLYKEIVGKDWDIRIAQKEKGLATIYCLIKTNSKEELAEIYSAADYYVNPTHEDNLPTTNLEAIACGTKVITYDVGGCKETLSCSNRP